MSKTFEAVSVTTPYGAIDTCLHLTASESAAYHIGTLNIPDGEGDYTFSMWLKASASCMVTMKVLGEYDVYSATTTWQKYSTTVMDTDDKDIYIMLPTGVDLYAYELYCSDGVIDTSWSAAPEDISDALATAIQTVDVEYALGNNSTTAPETGWNTASPAWTAGKYVWQRTKITTAGSSTPQYSSAVCIQGAKGEAGTSVTILGSYDTLAELQEAHPTGSEGDGYLVNGSLYVWNGSAWEDVGSIKGENGTSVTVTSWSAAYQVSTSGTNVPSGTWSSSPVATTAAGQYLWTRTTVIYSDGTTSKAYAVAAHGATGARGAQGAQGDQGIGVSEIVEQYAMVTSGSTPAESDWSTTQPTWQEGYAIWTRSEVTWTDSSVTTTSPVLANAINSANETAVEAAKVATNYLAYDATTGLDVGFQGSAAKTNISGSGVSIYDGNGLRRTVVDTDGMKVLNGDGDAVASFGDKAVLGTSDGMRIEVSSSGVTFVDSSNTQVGRIGLNLLGKSEIYFDRAIINGCNIGSLINYKTYSLDNQTISAASAATLTKDVTGSTDFNLMYTPIGVIGFDLDNATSSGKNVSYCNVIAVTIANGEVNWQIYNTGSAAAKIKAKATVLYVANGYTPDEP